jgi:chromosome segregation ATPase
MEGTTEADAPMPTAAMQQTLVSAKALSIDDFASNIKAHNTLLENCFALSKEVQLVKDEQARLVASSRATEVERNELISSLQQKIEQHDRFRKEDREKYDADVLALQTSVDDRLQKHIEDTGKSLRQMDETLTPQFKALEKTMDGLVQKQSEIVTDTLPKWRAEMSCEVQKLTTDLSRLQEATSANLEALQKKLKAEHDARELAASNRIDWISNELNEIKSKIFQAEFQIASTETTLQQMSSELKTKDDELATKIENQGDKFTALLTTTVANAKEEVSKNFASRIQGLEDAFKQVDFERLQAQERLHQEIVAKVKELSTTSERSFQDAEAARTKMKAELEAFRTELNTKAAAVQVDQNCSHLQQLEEKANSLQNNVRSLDDRLTSATETLQLDLQNQRTYFEDKAKRLESSIESVRSDHGRDIVTLNAGQSQSCEDHKRLADSMKKEFEDVRSKLSEAQIAIDAQEKQTSSIFQRMDPLSEVVREVVEGLQICNKTQENIDDAMRQMKMNIENMSHKMGPLADAQRRLSELEWYVEKTMSFAGSTGSCLSCGRGGVSIPSGRSTSPFGRSHETRFNETLLASNVGWSVKQPHTARPSSARRTRGEAVDSGSVQMGPAGTGIFAARFQRTAPVTVSTTATSAA